MVEKVQIETPEPVEPVVETPVETPATEVEQPKEKILGKFETQDDLIKSYQELEKKISAPKAEDKGLEIEAKAEEAVAQAGLDMSALQTEYDDNGELSQNSIDKLTAVGIDKNIIDAYIDGQTALAQNIEADIKSAVGGNDQYKGMVEWAKENLSAEEVTAYNNTVNSRDIASVKLAVTGLKARMDAGREPNLVQGKASVSTGGYESWAQVTQAMADPKYTKDPAYQAEVQSKLNNSNL
tara:strand:+ start:1468 stop:2184 length:717 start_codon:yes stop_codon:yes gene_type:complete